MAKKKETGQSAQEYIQSKIIDIAKGKIFDNSLLLNKEFSEIKIEDNIVADTNKKDAMEKKRH